MKTFPTDLIIELVTGPDLGEKTIEVTIPPQLQCPFATVPVPW